MKREGTIAALAAIVATFLAVFYLYRKPVVLLGTLAALLALAAWLHRDKRTWLVAAIVAATMLVAEWACVQRGIWRYAGTAGPPPWLAPLWALVAFFAVDVNATLV